MPALFPEAKLATMAACFSIHSSEVVIVILNYCGADDTITCVQSLQQLAQAPLEIAVVDNNSPDDSVNRIKAAFPEITILVAPNNNGYAAGNNAGIRYALANARCQAVWLLNNDTVVAPDSLDELCACLNAYPQAGIAGSTQICMESDAVQCAGGGAVNPLLGTTRSLCANKELAVIQNLAEEGINQNLDFAIGASMLVRRNVFEKVGYLPEEYFLYYEDVDYGLAAKEAGYSTVWAKRSIVRHKEGGASKAGSRRYPAHVDYLILRNRMYLVCKFYKWNAFFALLGYFAVAYNRIRRGQTGFLRHLPKAIWDGYTGRMGQSETYLTLKKRQKCVGKLPTLGSEPKIALVVATLGRGVELDRLLSSLEQQTYKNFQILLADQNPAGFLDEVLQRHSTLPLERAIIPATGVSAARNSFLPLDDSVDIVAFPDDDCWYAPDTLANVIRAFRRKPGAGAVLGAWGEENAINPVAEGWQSAHQLFKRAGTLVQFYRAGAIEDIQFDCMLGPGTNLPFGCGEDTDFLLRASAVAPVWRDNAIHVFHPLPLENGVNSKKLKAYAAGRMYLLQKHHLPLWFVLANIVYPLLVLPRDMLRNGWQGAHYRWAMFAGRLRAWL